MPSVFTLNKKEKKFKGYEHLSFRIFRNPPPPKHTMNNVRDEGKFTFRELPMRAKKPLFFLNCNIYQILCQLKLVIIEENMDAVWKDVIQPRRVPLHDESVHNACAIIKMVIHQDHTKKTCFRRLLFYIPPKSF